MPCIFYVLYSNPGTGERSLGLLILHINDWTMDIHIEYKEKKRQHRT